jgi:RNA polymerase sigma factor (TIGR02999 family)
MVSLPVERGVPVFSAGDAIPLDVASKPSETRHTGAPVEEASRVGGAPSGDGDADGAELADLPAEMYAALKRIAHRQLRQESQGHTLSTTAIVHEAWLRLSGQNTQRWASRAQFFSVAARTMRRVLIDYARQHHAARRGGGATPLTLDALDPAAVATLSVDSRAELLLALDEALERLSALDARAARIVEYRYFAGWSEAETAEALQLSVRTVSRDWRAARAWLLDALIAHHG